MTPVTITYCGPCVIGGSARRAVTGGAVLVTVVAETPHRTGRMAVRRRKGETARQYASRLSTIGRYMTLQGHVSAGEVTGQ